MEQGQKTPAAKSRLKPARYAPTRFPTADKAPALARRLVWRADDALRFWRASTIAELEDRRGFLWLPVAFGTGILIYFALPREPLLAALGFVVFALAAWAIRAFAGGGSYRLAVVLCLIAAGAASAKMRVDRLIGPELDRSVTASITGRVIRVDQRAERPPRLVLDDIAWPGRDGEATPRRIRISLRGQNILPEIGDRIRLRARLGPVPGPAMPGAYDPRRAAFFDGIAASGFAFGKWAPAEGETAGAAGFSPAIALAQLRRAIAKRIRQADDGQAGAIAAALIVGDRSGLSRQTVEHLRIAGLAHILAISGLHMALVAGTAFALLRALLALSPGLALSYPIKKWAALAALAVGLVYLALSGGNVATIRAYVMTAVMFCAILIDRPAISLRNLAIAAFIVLGFQPESVVEPGFQMSFAAVAGLIAGWEVWRERQRLHLADPSPSRIRRLAKLTARAFAGIALTTLIAGLATAPFAAFHFQKLSAYSLAGNLAAMPLVSLVIMPAGLFSLAAMPFGLETLVLPVMFAGIDALLAVSAAIAELEGALVTTPKISAFNLILISAGFVWLCLWRPRFRLFGLLPIAAGLLLVPLMADPPDLVMTADGRAVGVRDAGGTLRIAGSRKGSFIVEQWLEAEGSRAPDRQAIRDGVACDRLGCILRARGAIVVAHIRDPAAFIEDCRRADIVLTPLRAPDDCAASLVIDGRATARRGAHAIYFEGPAANPVNRVRIVTAWPKIRRPWQGRPSAP
ncbi:MAG: ComEC family competence protein [Alphaproteobacteria bacterium]|nr:MAG: ComEC family competence protein [Alphaproteobacteria bacterium]